MPSNRAIRLVKDDVLCNKRGSTIYHYEIIISESCREIPVFGTCKNVLFKVQASVFVLTCFDSVTFDLLQSN